MQPYVYTPLKENCIRLVAISLTPEDEITVSIKNELLDIEDPLTYSALSYVWGDPSRTTTISCDGASMQITTTLDAALRRIISTNPHGLVWIDQICINQEDLDERAEQVKMMNTIFYSAETVLIWLGPSKSSTELAVKVITQVGEIAKKAVGDPFLWDYDEYHPQELESYEDLTVADLPPRGIQFVDEDDWVAFSDFYDNAWFERIWIVQEVLPARKAIVMCGAHAVPWDLVKGAATWYHWKGRKLDEGRKRAVDGVVLTMDMNLTWNGRSGSERLAALLGQKTRPHHTWGIDRLLTTFRGRKATDARDKVYALLGLSDMSSDTRTGRALGVDYAKDVRTVYTDAVRAVIRLNNHLAPGNLDIIMAARRSTCACFRSEEEGDWPSWVPDWRLHSGFNCQWGIGVDLPAWHARYAKNGSHKDPEEEEGLEKQHDAASQDDERPMSPPADRFALRTKGVVVGRAVYASAHRHMGDVVQHGNMRRERDTVAGMLASSYPTGEAVDTALALTFVGGVMPEPMRTRNTSAETLGEQWLGWVDAILMPRQTPEQETARRDRALLYKDFGFDNAWLQAVMDAYCERRLYVLDTGYVGLGNHHMQVGDVVAVLVGLSVPCVLRPRGDGPDDGYTFIGEAYCHGAMDGQGAGKLPIREDADPAAVLQELVLR